MQYILSLSYGKDSLACLGAIKELGLPLDRIVHAEIWATDTIHADLPPMIEFKAKVSNGSKSFNAGHIYGFPCIKGSWCNSKLKMSVLRQFNKPDIIQYIGIAADELNRFHNLTERKKSPLVIAGWNEKKCREWCIENDLLSPIYTTAQRGGCWFCHNQGVEQLRLLRKNYPDLWQLFLKWDTDSPVSFKLNVTLHDFESRFALEDKGVLQPNDVFRWSMLSDDIQLKFFPTKKQQGN